MKTKETKKVVAATAQAVRKADQEKVRSPKQREASPDGTTKGERATTQSGKGVPRTPTAGNKAKKSAKATSKAERPSARESRNRGLDARRAVLVLLERLSTSSAGSFCRRGRASGGPRPRDPSFAGRRGHRWR